MNDSHTFDNPDVFLPGAQGEPGNRVFYLYSTKDGNQIFLKVEKQQIIALCEYLEQMILDYPDFSHLEVIDQKIESLESIEWIVGAISLGYDVEQEKFIILLEELVLQEENPQDEFDELLALVHARRARFLLTSQQITFFIQCAQKLVSSGRELCRLCGNPINLTGHFCPRNN